MPTKKQPTVRKPSRWFAQRRAEMELLRHEIGQRQFELQAEDEIAVMNGNEDEENYGVTFFSFDTPEDHDLLERKEDTGE